MDQRADGLVANSKDVDPEAQARDLEQEVDAIRDELGDLVGELDRRRHRAAKPVMLGAAAVAASAGALAGFLLWRRHARSKTAFGFVRDLLGIA
jgi:hypothetical protein